VALVVTAFCYVIAVPKLPPGVSENLAFTLAVVAFLSGIFMFVVAGRLVRLLNEKDSYSGQINQWQKRCEAVEVRVKRLQVDLELLTAMREVSRIVSDEVDFKRIFERVLKIVEELLDAEEITVFRGSPASNFVPVARRKGGRTFFGEAIGKEDLQEDLVRAAWQHNTLIRAAEDERLTFFSIVEADQEKVGILRVTTQLLGEPEEKAEKAEQYESFLRSISKHIALAIKTTVLHTRSVIDSLTGLGNRALFQKELTALISLSERHGWPLSLLMLDLDHFKRVNDLYGHTFGDKVLVRVARLIGESLRKSDTAYRYGGEELAVILPHTGLSAAFKLAERIRAKIEKEKFKISDGAPFRVTASLGVAGWRADSKTLLDLVDRADAGLYLAKKEGRNCVRSIDPGGQAPGKAPGKRPEHRR